MASRPASWLPRCGARTKTRGGRPCRASPVLDAFMGEPRNGRCKLHGGLSTGRVPQRGGGGSQRPSASGGADGAWGADHRGYGVYS